MILYCCCQLFTACLWCTLWKVNWSIVLDWGCPKETLFKPHLLVLFCLIFYLFLLDHWTFCCFFSFILLVFFFKLRCFFTLLSIVLYFCLLSCPTCWGVTCYFVCCLSFIQALDCLVKVREILCPQLFNFLNRRLYCELFYPTQHKWS